ncbi:MAG TPA: photosynthetic reaction center cytochrome c subunit family protein [Bryobacteraceae bacterium]|jgi:photosynthetic reaction center cytochrome c subunit|nr:photosynthetic reaction center cytochrome c subunit family protein [Bryobacteraceae bacterium]
MKLPSKGLMFTGAIALLGAVPFGGVAFAQAKPQMADDVFKNIQVLKGLTVDEFMGTMGLFSAALNVCCGDCHVGAGGSDPQWDKDVPRKQVARKMISMMQGINKTNFGGAQMVTCWTCHRGTGGPATTPPIDAIYSDPVQTPPDVLTQATQGTAVPTADQIFDKYIQALGGAANLAKLTSYTAKGTSLLFGNEKGDPAEIYAKAPNQLTTIVHQREGDLERVTDGQGAWVVLPLTVVQEYGWTASALEGAKLDGQMAFPGGIKGFLNNWRVSYPTTIDGRDIYVVQGSHAPGMIATFYFDQKTGLLRRMIRYANSAVGRVPTQWDYSDYRPVAGVMMPFKYTFGWVSGREDYTITDVQPNAPVDESKFAKPVPKAR